MELFLNGAELSLNSMNLGNLINYCSTNWPEFKDPAFHMCHSGTFSEIFKKNSIGSVVWEIALNEVSYKF